MVTLTTVLESPRVENAFATTATRAPKFDEMEMEGRTALAVALAVALALSLALALALAVALYVLVLNGRTCILAAALNELFEISTCSYRDQTFGHCDCQGSTLMLTMPMNRFWHWRWHWL